MNDEGFVSFFVFFFFSVLLSKTSCLSYNTSLIYIRVHPLETTCNLLLLGLRSL